jgi:hypothetical protein
MADLLQRFADFFAQDEFEWVLFHADDINGRELPLGNSRYEFHTNEGGTNNNHFLSLLCR